MKNNKLAIFSLCIFAILATNQGYCQQGTAAQEKIEFLWVLGDIVSLDLENSQMTLSCFNPGTKKEARIKIAIDNHTLFEHAQSLNDLKVGDVVAVNYKTSSTSRPIAMNVRLEKFRARQ